MALWRCEIQLAIPLEVYNALPLAKKIAARDAIRSLKVLAVKINAGLPNEEMTVKAKWHICHHDEETGAMCEPEVEI